MEASVKDSAASSRQELEQLQQKVKQVTQVHNNLFEARRKSEYRKRLNNTVSIYVLILNVDMGKRYRSTVVLIWSQALFLSFIHQFAKQEKSQAELTSKLEQLEEEKLKLK